MKVGTDIVKLREFGIRKIESFYLNVLGEIGRRQG